MILLAVQKESFQFPLPRCPFEPGEDSGSSLGDLGFSPGVLLANFDEELSATIPASAFREYRSLHSGTPVTLAWIVRV